MPVILDPILKLELLGKYMNKRIDRKSVCYIDFDNWVYQQYPQYSVGSPEYYRSISTNCYYCQREFDNKKYKPTIDHFFPESKDGKGNEHWFIFVISCGRCNLWKGDIHPAEFIRMFTVADMKGEKLFNMSAKEIKRVSQNCNAIFNDVMMGVQKKVYYKNNKPHHLPKHFINY